jgi:hypothetical protein
MLGVLQWQLLAGRLKRAPAAASFQHCKLLLNRRVLTPEVRLEAITARDNANHARILLLLLRGLASAY